MSTAQVPMQMEATRLRLENGLAVIAAVVGFIMSFFHWYGITPPGAASSTIYLNGWHGWGIPAAILFLLAALIGIGGLAGMDVIPAAREGMIMAVIGVAAAICTILFMVTEGSGYGAGYDKGPLFGAWIGLICAIVIAVDGVLLMLDSGRSARA